LEGVIEHRHLVHRLEEALGGQDQGQEHADLEVAAEDPETAREQHEGHAHVPDQDQPGLEDAVEVDGADGRAPVVLRQVGVARGILAFLPERLHGPDTGHGLHEVHDQPGRDHPGFAEGDL
jgi:hypothetical protein